MSYYEVCKKCGMVRTDAMVVELLDEKGIPIVAFETGQRFMGVPDDKIATIMLYSKEYKTKPKECKHDYMRLKP
jgi:hypothetical protein